MIGSCLSRQAGELVELPRAISAYSDHRDIISPISMMTISTRKMGLSISSIIASGLGLDLCMGNLENRVFGGRVKVSWEGTLFITVRSFMREVSSRMLDR